MGWATSIRFIGPLAGVLVSGYFLYKAKSKAIAPLIVYWVIAGLATFTTWPFLWEAPIARFIRTFRVMGDFPWEGVVLHRGTILGSEEIPLSYVPDLLTLQLTETVLVSSTVGLLVALSRARFKTVDRPALIVMGLWLLLPLLALLLLDIQVYDCFRHMLYILPPIFVLSGIGLDAVLGLVRRKALQGGAIAIV